MAGALVADSLRPPRWRFGLPALAAPGAEGLRFIGIPAMRCRPAVADVLAALKGPLEFGLWGDCGCGAAFEIAGDDPKMMSYGVTSLPADT
ncbi:colicin-like bacteriocin tRNase domain-containing protein [Klebsiella pneumoniae]|uniref:colicin-like bacteriocin tRNase domain-containing protein n=1 Tax=Klebsiella pneumoniae TaxID=573 RepID=UPI00351F189B